MELIEKRYEFGYKDVTIEGIKGIAFDIVPKPHRDEMGFKYPHLSILGGDAGDDKNGNQLGHQIYGCIPVKNIDNLKLIQMGLEMIEMALYNDATADDLYKDSKFEEK